MPWRIASTAWILLMIFWLVSALRVKRNAQVSTRQRVFQTLLLIPAGVLLFDPSTSVGVLALRFVPDSLWVGEAGLGLTIPGIAFAIWARAYLGGNWSPMPSIKRDHTLVRGGPYAIVRHPIYTGILTGLLGSAVIRGELRGLIAVAMASAGLWIKLRVEERLMRGQFGEEYALYMQHVKALVPFVL